MAPPRLGSDDRDPPTLDRLNYELHSYFDLGSLFTAVAGLLNILVIFDAWGGPVFPEPKRPAGPGSRNAPPGNADDEVLSA